VATLAVSAKVNWQTWAGSGLGTIGLQLLCATLSQGANGTMGLKKIGPKALTAVPGADTSALTTVNSGLDDAGGVSVCWVKLNGMTPFEITATALATIPPAVCGGVIVTLGGEVQLAPNVFSTIVLTKPSGPGLEILAVAIGSGAQPPPVTVTEDVL